MSAKQGQCGVYKLFKLSKGVGNTFTKDFKKLERDLHVVTHEYAEKMNRFSEINGVLYEYDEKASDLYWAKKPFKNVKEYVKFEEVKEYNEDDLSELKATYEELTGKKPHHLWKKDKIEELIEKLK